MEYAFISYAMNDCKIAEELIRLLSENGIRTMNSHSSAKTKDIITSDECKCFILLLSKYSQNSLPITEELGAAFGNTFIFPINIDGCTLSDDMSFYLGTVKITSVHSFAFRSPEVVNLLSELKPHFKAAPEAKEKAEPELKTERKAKDSQKKGRVSEATVIGREPRICKEPPDNLLIIKEIPDENKEAFKAAESEDARTKDERSDKEDDSLNIYIGLGGFSSDIVRLISEKEKDKAVCIIFDFADAVKRDAGGIKVFTLDNGKRPDELISLCGGKKTFEWLPERTAEYPDFKSRFLTRLYFLYFTENTYMINGFNDYIDLILDESGKRRVKFNIITSLSGSTGSGIFIQLALLLRKRLSLIGREADVNGIFILPDVFCRLYSYDGVLKDIAESRAYASLKELEEITRLKQNARARVNHFFDSLFPDGTCRDGGAVYDSYTLIGDSLKSEWHASKLSDYAEIVSGAVIKNTCIIISKSKDERCAVYKRGYETVMKEYENNDGVFMILPHLDKRWRFK